MSERSLVTIEKDKLPEVFTDSGADKIIAELRKKAQEFIPDLSTVKGRNQIKTNAAKFSASKTVVEDFRKEFKSDLAKQVKIIDSAGKKMRDVCDELKAEVRKPLTEWEAEEAEKKEKLRIAEELKAEQLRIAKELEESHEQAILLNDLRDREKAIEAKEAKIEAEKEAQRLADEKKQAELDRIAHEEKLKADAVAEEQRKHNAKIEAERLESAKREAQAIIDKEAAEKAVQDGIERERLAAEKVISDAKEAEDKRLQAVKQAAIDRQAAIDKATKDAEEAAAKKELERLAQELADKRAEEARQQNEANRKRVKREALASMIEAGYNKQEAMKFIQDVAEGKFKKITINF